MKMTEDNQAILELYSENKRLREEIAQKDTRLATLAKIINDTIVEKDGPNRLLIDGVWHEGEVVDAYFKVFELVTDTIDKILKSQPDCFGG